MMVVVSIGRASMSPILDTFMTLLSMGMEGWKKLLRDREVRVMCRETIYMSLVCSAEDCIVLAFCLCALM